MAYGVILKHLEVDKITWGGSFSKKKNFFKEGWHPLRGVHSLRGALMAFSVGKRGGAPSISKKKYFFKKNGADSLFGGKEGRGAL
jgi:hypothetical protein